MGGVLTYLQVYYRQEAPADAFPRFKLERNIVIN